MLEKILKYILMPGLVFNFLACSDTEIYDSELRSSILETETFFEITAIGASYVNSERSIAEAKRHAGEVARFQAYQLLAEALQGVAVTGDIRLRDLKIGEGKLLQVVQAKLVGVRETGPIKYEEQFDGSWLASCSIQYDKAEARKLVQTISSNSMLLSDQNEIEFTGVVFDLRFEFHFDALLTPVVVNSDGKTVFSPRSLTREGLLENEIIPVYPTIRDAVVADNGVGLMPVKIVPERYDTENGLIILSESDSERLKSIDYLQRLLSNGHVAIIM